MKRFFLIISALVVLGFTSCGKDPIDEPQKNDEESRKVPVSFELTLGNTRTDFSNFLTNASQHHATITWNKTGYETVYLGVVDMYDRNPRPPFNVRDTFELARLVPLRAECNGSNTLVFTGDIDDYDLEDGKSYVIYYFGNENSGNLSETSIDENGKLVGLTLDLSAQDGTRGNLGNCHFATIDVNVTSNYDSNGYPISYSLNNTNGNFTTGIAMALLDLEGETKLEGTATDYNAVEVLFNRGTNKYSINHKTIGGGGITLNNASNSSWIALCPNATAGVGLECSKGEFVFNEGVQRNTAYYVDYQPGSGGREIKPLKWTKDE